MGKIIYSDTECCLGFSQKIQLFREKSIIFNESNKKVSLLILGILLFTTGIMAACVLENPLFLMLTMLGLLCLIPASLELIIYLRLRFCHQKKTEELNSLISLF